MLSKIVCRSLPTLIKQTQRLSAAGTFGIARSFSVTKCQHPMESACDINVYKDNIASENYDNDHNNSQQSTTVLSKHWNTLYDHNNDSNFELNNNGCWDWKHSKLQAPPIANTQRLNRTRNGAIGEFIHYQRTFDSNIIIDEDFQSIHRVTLQYNITMPDREIPFRGSIDIDTMFKTMRTENIKSYNFSLKHQGSLNDWDGLADCNGSKRLEQTNFKIEDKDIVTFELNLLNRTISVWKNNAINGDDGYIGPIYDLSFFNGVDAKRTIPKYQFVVSYYDGRFTENSSYREKPCMYTYQYAAQSIYSYKQYCLVDCAHDLLCIVVQYINAMKYTNNTYCLLDD